MSYATEEIIHALRRARKDTGMNQRELSAKSGVPQAQISKIENGAVDLRISSLVALARALDLELMLVPRKNVSAVKAVVRSSARSTLQDGQVNLQVSKELSRFQASAENLSKKLVRTNEFEQFQRQLRELKKYKIAPMDVEAIKNIRSSFETLRKSTDDFNAIKTANAQFQELRNALAHGNRSLSLRSHVIPAYSLDEDDNA